MIRFMKCLQAVIPVLMAVCTVNAADNGFENTSPINTQKSRAYYLEDGVIKMNGPAQIKLESKILYFSEEGGFIYYIREDSGLFGGTGTVAGYLPVEVNDSDSSFEIKPVAEIKISFEYEIENVRRIYFTPEAAFILINGKKGGFGSLHRISLADGVEQKKEGVRDARICDGTILFVGSEGDGTFVEYGGERVPLLLEGDITISKVENSCIAFVENGESCEIVDFIRRKNIYRFSAGTRMAEPGEYNLVITALDDAPDAVKGAEEDMVYYKVFIDGVEAGRTDTGVNVLDRNFHVKCSPDEYHFVRLERWKLDRIGQDYKRENNIMQPESLRLYIPSNRIIRLVFRFDGMKYGIKTSPVIE